MTPVHMPLGEPARPVDGRCRRRSSKTVRCEPPKRWFILPCMLFMPEIVKMKGAGVGGTYVSFGLD